jgi:predicted nucleotide-binding protein (sugar kinase/HSP70/actin superfamily)
MSFDVDKEEFYETFAELQDAEGAQRALEWAWSAFDWTQQELRKEAAKSQSIAAEERAAVVAWLHDCALDPETTGAEMRLFQNLATTIERGEHRREEKE